MNGPERRNDHSAEQLDALARELGALRDIDPPPSLLRAVMQDIHGVSTAGAGGFQRPTRGVVMRTKVLWGLAAAAALVLAAFGYTGFPPAEEGAEGAIGAAKRYQAGQIGASDVKLGDQEAQNFLQSDLFDRIMKDDGMRKALSDPAIRTALTDPAIKLAITNPDFLAHARGVRVDQGIFDVALQATLLDADVVSALKVPAVSAAIADNSLAVALNDLALGRQLTNPTLARVLSDQALLVKLNDAVFLKALNNGAMRVLLSDAAFLHALGHRALLQALIDPAFARAIASVDMQRAFTDAGFAKAIQSPAFTDALMRGNHQ